MKTSIKTFLTTALTAVFLSSTAFTTTANDSIQKTVKASAMNVNMVVVTGDVDVYVIHSDKEDIKVVPFGEQEAKVSFKKRGSKLYINSKEAERATIYVYLKDLKRIDASNSSTVKTKGDFNPDALQIFLKDNAKANVDVNTKSLYTVIKDQSSLKLSGATDAHFLEKGTLASIKVHNFNAAKTEALTVKPQLAVIKKK